MTIKDWLEFAVSFVALGVSITTAYLNVVVQRDDLRVFIGRPPWVQTNSEKEVEVVGEQELTFINLGNRAAAVTSLGANVIPMQTVKDASTCSGAHEFAAYPIAFDAKPFIIKPGEISYIKTKVQLLGKGGAKSVAKAVYAPKEGDVLLACLRLRIVTPDSYVNEWVRPAFAFTMSLTTPADDKPLFDENVPISVVKRTRTVFFN